jgi:rod shape-determining protein MreC
VGEVVQGTDRRLRMRLAADYGRLDFLRVLRSRPAERIDAPGGLLRPLDALGRPMDTAPLTLPEEPLTLPEESSQDGVQNGPLAGTTGND